MIQEILRGAEDVTQIVTSLIGDESFTLGDDGGANSHVAVDVNDGETIVLPGTVRGRVVEKATGDFLGEIPKALASKTSIGQTVVNWAIKEAGKIANGLPENKMTVKSLINGIATPIGNGAYLSDGFKILKNVSGETLTLKALLGEALIAKKEGSLKSAPTPGNYDMYFTNPYSENLSIALPKTNFSIVVYPAGMDPIED